MWSPHKPDCKCARCEEAEQREKKARIEAEQRELEHAVFEAAMALYEVRLNASTAERVTRAHEEAMDAADDALDEACNAVIDFETKMANIARDAALSRFAVGIAEGLASGPKKKKTKRKAARR